VLRRIVFQNTDRWRERRALREIDKQITSLLSQIGFSPTDRATLGIGDHQQHEFAKIRNRIEAKRAASSE